MPPTTLQQTFELARRLHQAGRLAEADKLYRQILAQQPQHAEALHLRGMLAGQRGNGQLALELLQQAATLSPGSSLVHYNLGTALLKSQGKLKEAADAFRRAIALQPNYAEAHNNLGIALNQSGRREEAVAAFRRAVGLRPDYAPGLYNLGDALKAMGQADDAIAAYRKAIALQPGYAEARNNLGNVLLEQRHVDAAIAEYQRAVALQPGRAEFHANLGNALKDKKQYREAIAAYRQAIALAPDYCEGHYNLGNILKDTGQLDEAIASLKQAIFLRPTYTEAHYNLGNAFKDAGQVGMAIEQYKKAIDLNPTMPEPGDNLVYAMMYQPGIDGHTIADELRRWNTRHAASLLPTASHYPNNRDANRRLRIGYVGADFREHCQSLFLLPLLSSHDRGQVEVFCYSNARDPDARTAEFRQHADGWRDSFGQSDEQVAAIIRQDQIDILVDLTMHMAGNRLLTFARKPAPIQVTWLAYPGSTGLTAIDYRLSDPYLDPIGIDESIYSEETIRLPDSFWCYDPLGGRDIPVNALPALSASNGPALSSTLRLRPEGSSSNGPALQNGPITFGCLNNFCKINDDVLNLWAQVLTRVNNSRLILLAPQGNSRQRTLDKLASRGVEPGRIEFVTHCPRREYLELYHRVDIGLDTFPYNGHTTSLDAFWMGVPVVTLLGKTAVGRAGWSQLSNLGLCELAGESEEQFVEIAVKLATNLARLAELRASLRNRLERSPLMDAARFARNIELAYRQMWRKWCESAPTDAKTS